MFISKGHCAVASDPERSVLDKTKGRVNRSGKTIDSAVIRVLRS
jgi:hypothetical protein